APRGPASVLRLCPATRIAQRVSQGDPGGDLGVLLEPPLVAVHEERYFGRDPGSADGPVIVEADVARARRVTLTGLEQSHEEEPVLVHPELAGPQIPPPRPHDVRGPAVP